MEEKKDVVDGQEKATEKEPEQTTGKEYDEAWDEAEALEAGKKPEEKEPEKKPEPESQDRKPDDAPKPPEPEKKPADDGKEKPLTGIEKALHDTKVFATKLSQENANLKKLLAEKDSAEREARLKEAEAAQKAAQEKLKGSLEAAYTEYPELKDVLDTMNSQLDATRKELGELNATEERRKKEREKLDADRQYFEASIKPEVVKVHKDFDAIMQSQGQEFFRWAEQQSPAIKTAVFQSTDPRDMIMALDKFKSDKSSGYIADMKKQDETNRQDKLKNAQTLRGGATIPESAATAKKDDYDGGWEEAGKQLEKEGVT